MSACSYLDPLTDHQHLAGYYHQGVVYSVPAKCRRWDGRFNSFVCCARLPCWDFGKWYRNLNSICIVLSFRALAEKTCRPQTISRHAGSWVLEVETLPLLGRKSFCWNKWDLLRVGGGRLVGIVLQLCAYLLENRFHWDEWNFVQFDGPNIATEYSVLWGCTSFLLSKGLMNIFN